MKGPARPCHRKARRQLSRLGLGAFPGGSHSLLSQGMLSPPQPSRLPVSPQHLQTSDQNRIYSRANQTVEEMAEAADLLGGRSGRCGSRSHTYSRPTGGARCGPLAARPPVLPGTRPLHIPWLLSSAQVLGPAGDLDGSEGLEQLGARAATAHTAGPRAAGMKAREPLRCHRYTELPTCHL